MAKETQQFFKKSAQERREIGVPAGESPAEGRTRHGTYSITDEEEIELTRRRGYVESEENIDDQYFREDGNEISATGGITGTKVKGGIPAGGSQAGGTLGTPQKPQSWEDKT